MAIEKIKILGAVLELPAKLHCQFSLFTAKMGQIGSAYCFAGSSKTALRILDKPNVHIILQDYVDTTVSTLISFYP